MKKILTTLLIFTLLLGINAPSALASSVDAPGEATSSAVLTADAIRFSVTVPTSVMIYVDSSGNVYTPEQAIINNSAAPIVVTDLEIRTENGWTLDPATADYTKFKVGKKNFSLLINGVDTAYGPIALNTPIYGHSSLPLVLSADVAPQKEMITATKIGEMIITVGWYSDEGAGDNQDYDFDIHSVTHGDTGQLNFFMTVDAPAAVEYAMLPAGSPPPTNGTSSFNLDYAGTQTQSVDVYGGYDSSIDYDIYIWVYDAEWTPIGPVKVLLAGTGGGTGDTGGTGTIPEGYVIPNDGDWYGEADGEFAYIGTAEYVAIPDVIKGNPVTSFRSMFALTYVKGVYSANGNVTDTSEMFMSSYADSLDININTSKLVNTDGMFVFAAAVTGSVYTQADADKFNASMGKPEELIFTYSSGGTGEGTNPDTGDIIVPEGYVLATESDFTGPDYDGLFKYIGTDAYVAVPHTINGTPVTTYRNMFSNTDVKGVYSDNQNITNMQNMFAGTTADSLELDLYTSNVNNMTGMFSNSKAESLDLSGFDTSSVEYMSSMFANSEATSINLAGFNTSSVGYMDSMFAFSQAESLDLSGFDTKNVVQFSAMFQGTQAASLDLSGWDTSNALSMTDMFRGAQATSLDLSGFDVSKVTQMTSMFRNSQATSIDFSGWNTSSVTHMDSMFESSKADSLDLSGFNTSNVTKMESMFAGAQAKSINLSNFNTSKITNLYNMFNSAQVEVLDLSSFDTTGVIGMLDTFKNCVAITGYARTQADADKLNLSSGKPETLVFVVK